MKKLITAFLLSACLISAQEAGENKEEQPAKKEALQYQIDLDNLPSEKRQAYFNMLFKAQSLFNQKRIFETLAQIEDVHKIYAKAPSSLNIQGACYVEFRNFPKAKACFNKALKSHPDNPNVLFNLAEIDFVTQEWQSSHDLLIRLEENFSDQNSMVELIKFKSFLCKIKLGQKEEAQSIADKTSFLDDSLMHFYANAALEYADDQPARAEAWLARASRIFQNNQQVAPWQDTLIEFGYIKSFYGGDLLVD